MQETEQKKEMRKVKCPFCGYEMPIFYRPGTAACRDIFVKCKGKHCRKEFIRKIKRKKKVQEANITLV